MSITAPFFLQQLTDNNGKVLSGGKLYTYVGGSTNLPKTTYYDKDYTIPAPNPLICDASGTLPQYFLTSGAYKFAVYTSNDVLVATRDWIYGNSGSTSGTGDDHKVAVNGSDTQPGFLTDKLVPGSSIQISTVNIPGLGLKTSITDDGRIRTNSSDSTTDYLANKIVNSSTVTWKTVGNTNKKLTANVNDKYKTVIPVWAIVKTTDPDIAPFGLSTTDLEKMWSLGYGVATTLTQGEGPNGYLRIYSLSGGTYYGDATWTYTAYDDGQLILNANHGLYDYMTKLPLDPQNQDLYSNYPAGLYVMTRDGDNHLWTELVVKNYPDPEYNTNSVLTYNGYEKKFQWVANDNLQADGSVKIDENDQPGFLGYKVQAGPGIAITDTYNGVYGNFLSISSSATNPSGGQYTSTMYVANATSTLAPNIISRTELICLFIPTTDYTVTYNQSLFGMFVSQGGTGNLTFTLRDDQYRLIAASSSISNPSPLVFLELVTAMVQNPITQTSLNSYKLNAGDRYYLGISTTANGLQFIGDDAVQNVNVQPYPAYKVDNITGGLVYQLSGGGESKLRPFVRLKG